jgi:hypothetical protein
MASAVFRVQVNDGLLPGLSAGAKTLWKDLSEAKYTRNAANAAASASLVAANALAHVERFIGVKIYRRVMFVAFRGVMTSNSHELRSRELEDWPSLDPYLIAHLKSFVDRFSAVIVLSTKWSSRPELYKRILKDLAENGIKESSIIGETNAECDWDCCEDCNASEIEQIRLQREKAIT